MPFAYSNGIRIHYRSQGAGHPLLLIGGVGYDGWFWHAIVPGLAERYQVIVPDLRGTGETDETEGPYSVEMLGKDLEGVLDDLHIRGAFVVGHSLGAYIAQQITLSRPELVSKLVIAAGNFGGPNAVPMSEEAREILTDREGDQPELIKRGIEIATAPGFAAARPEVVQELVEYRLSDAVSAVAYEAQVAADAAMAAEDAGLEERLGEIGVPTLLLFAEHDQVVPPANAELMAQRIPHAQVTILPDAGHLFPIEAPQATVDALVGFFGGRRYLV